MQIISIGFLGSQRCYIDVPREEAIARYLESESMTEWDSFITIKEIEAPDGEFWAYDIGEG